MTSQEEVVSISPYKFIRYMIRSDMPPSNNTGVFSNNAFEADECDIAGIKANLISYHHTQDFIC